MSSADHKWVGEIADIVTKITGVQFSGDRVSMLETRLLKRISELRLSDLEAYSLFIKENSQTEIPLLVGLLTSHHSFFFREFTQFEYLVSHIIPSMIKTIRTRPDKKLRIWSAACSEGQEVFSLAMFLMDWLRRNPEYKIDFEVRGTDVDPESIASAQNGVFTLSQLKGVPAPLFREFWSQGSGEIREYARAKDVLRKHCKFEQENLLGLYGVTPLNRFDVIFCRNVLIYFQPDEVQRVAESLLARLEPSGALIIGVSESLLPYELPIKWVAPSVYRPVSRVFSLAKRRTG